MAEPTGTLEWLNEFVSDTPTDIGVVNLRSTIIFNAISAIASELNAKLEQGQTLGEKSEEETVTAVNTLNRELERLLEIKRRLEALKR